MHQTANKISNYDIKFTVIQRKVKYSNGYVKVDNTSMSYRKCG